MAESCQVNTKYVYSAVLLIVLSAWFGHSTIKPPSSPKKKEVGNKQIISKIVEDPDILGIEPGKWIPGGSCNIEFINGSLIGDSVYPVDKGSILKLSGWAMDTEKRLLPSQIVIKFKSSDGNINFYAPCEDGLVREDVKEYFKLPKHLSASGFELTTTLQDIPVGQYGLSLIIQFGDSSYICDNGRKIIIEYR